jgi:trimethylamine--corrinoid protein Co-methyltransferase
MLKGFTRRFKPVDLLTDEEMEAIHRGALYLLEKTGVRVEHDGAVNLCSRGGCRVDYDRQRVRIPPGLAEACLRKCPSSYSIKARDPDRDLVVGGNTVHFMQGMGMRYVDLDTWETRPARSAPTQR